MLTARFVLFLLPVALFLMWLGLRTALGNRPSRFVATTVFSLVLLLYFLVVVGTGIFWVAAQELPVFDWHYLPGYILLIMTLVHVVLHWSSITALLRRSAPQAIVEHGGARFVPWVRTAGCVLAAGTAGALVFFLGVRHGSRTLAFTIQDVQGGAGASTRKLAAKPLVAPILVQSGGTSTTLAEYYQEGSSYPARASLPGLTLSERPQVYKEYPGHAEVALPPVKSEGGGAILEAFQAWISGAARPEAGELTLGQLSLLLYHTQGISKTLRVRGLAYDLRTAPSAGALYPVNVYVLVTKVAGLAPGLYYYHPKRAALLLVKADPMLADQLQMLSGSPDLYDDAPATVIFTVTFGRTAFKYRERAYRYVAMDTGHAAYNLGVCAASLGFCAPLIGRFDDVALNALVDVDPSVEAGFLIMPIGGSKGVSPEPTFQSDAAGRGGPSKVTFVGLIHGGTSLRLAGGSGQMPRHPSRVEGGPKDIPLPAPAQGTSLLPAIFARRSGRAYSTEPVSLEELSALCAASAQAQKDPGPGNPLLAYSAPLTLYALVHNVRDLGPGVYRYIPATHALQLVRKGDVSKACQEACFEQEFCGTAAVVFVKTVTWSDVLYPDGDRGYRYVNLHAGIMGEGLYVQSTALGLGVCGVGAFEDSGVASILGIVPGEEVPLYVTAVGKPRTQAAPNLAPALTNMDFEEGENGQPPPGWRFPKAAQDNGYRWTITTENPFQGKQCALFAGRSASFGAVFQSINAAPYRGKRVRFKAAVHAHVSGDGNWTGLWMRVDLKGGGVGFFDNMQDRPITSSAWKTYTVEGDVDTDAEAITVGLLLAGGGETWIDAGRFEVIGKAAGATP